MFVDIHSHIIPNVDDGADSRDTTLAMLQTAAKEGISSIIATPHYISGYNRYDAQLLEQQFELTKEIIRTNNLDISLYLGNELLLDIDALPSLEQKTCQTLAGSRYVLVELPRRWNVHAVENLLYNIEINGYQIILAHIERYEMFRDKASLLQGFIERGYYTQINTSSITTDDRRTKKYTDQLLRHNYVHFVATDCHTNGRRRPHMRRAYELVSKIIGDKADQLFNANAQKVIKNEAIEVEEPLQIKRFFLSGRGLKWSMNW